MSGLNFVWNKVQASSHKDEHIYSKIKDSIFSLFKYYDNTPIFLPYPTLSLNQTYFILFFSQFIKPIKQPEIARLFSSLHNLHSSIILLSY